MELNVGKKPKDLKINYTGKDVQRRLDIIRKFYNNLSDEDFKQRMIDAGFKIVEDGKGEFIYTENECPKCGGDMDKEGIECMYCGFSRC